MTVNENIKYVVVCDECGTAHEIAWKHRYAAVCVRCLQEKGVTIRLSLIPNKMLDPECLVMLQEDYRTWDEYIGQSKLA